MKAFSEPYPIIVPSASCAGMLKHQYAKLLNQSEWVENFSSRVWELSDFIAQNALKPWRALFHQQATEQKINKKRFSQLFNQSQARFSSLVSDEVIQHWASDDDHQLSIAIHHSCAALREMQVSQAVVTLLKTVPNIKLLQHQYSSECCGFGGTFAVKHPEISIMMAQDKCQHLADVQPDIIISQDNGCLMNIHGSWQHQPVLFRPVSSFLLDLALLMKP